MHPIIDDLNYPDTRRDALLIELSRSGRLVASELMQTYAVSADTIRRDLLALEQAGLLRRVRGGALPIARPTQPFHEREARGAPNLAALAAAAITLVERGSCLLLDGGTTMVACARALPAELALTIITPSPAVAVAAQANEHDVILIGGRLGLRSGSASGAEAERAIERCAADLCLLGACTFDASGGLGADDHDDASLKRSIIAASSRAAVVVSTEKFARRSRFRVIEAEALDVLVTDATQDLLAPFEALPLEIVRVE